MRWLRYVWGGVFLLLVSSGCSSDKSVNNTGTYAPVIAGISANPEPAVRDQDNQLTVLVTNPNGFALTYHWSTPWGALTDSTHQTATWLAPDSIGTYPVTCAVVGDGYYKSTTFHVFVDNDYVRWTSGDAVQFDPAPMSLGGVIFSQYRSIAAQTADVYTVPAAGMSPIQLTSGIYTAVSPTMRSDGQQFAFVGRPTATDSIGLWLLPGTGGDASALLNLASWNTNQRFLGAPRFARTGTMLLYGSDSSNVQNPKPWYLDVLAPGSTIQRVFAAGQQGINAFFPGNWGPDLNHDGLPDSIVAPSYRGFNSVLQVARGLWKLPTGSQQTSPPQWLADSSAAEPDWSPDGQYIVFTRPNSIAVAGGAVERDIWIINAGAANPSQAIRVTFGPADDSHPRFTDDGSTIFFVSNRDDRYGLNGVYPIQRRGTNIWSVSEFDKP